VTTPTEIIYKVKNPYANDGRDLYFICDPPHLIKSVRNAWANSKRLLWVRDCGALGLFKLIITVVQRKGDTLELLYLVKLYYDNRSRKAPEVALLTQRKYEHIFLTSYSKMRVDLAAQVKYY